MSNSKKDLTLYALDTLLEYAKLLEDTGHLSHDLLRQRVETYRQAPDLPEATVEKI